MSDSTASHGPHGPHAAELLVLGISHKTAPVALRERLALTDAAAKTVAQALVAEDAVDEAVVISTCNRTETYLVVRDSVQAETELLGRLARRAGIRPTELAGIVYSPRNCDAARQLFRVTSGLDSMILGESEVQGQVKRAYENALSAGTTGPLTNRMFTAALSTGKRVRSETEIAAAHVSVSTVAVEMASEAVGELRDRDVVVIGAGETSELTARALAERGVATIFVANRRADRAHALAERFGGTVVSLDELPARLEHADIVVSSTASPHAIVGVEELELVMAARNGRPLVLIDIAVPRDIEHACGDLPGVTLLDIDDLQQAVQRNLSVREGERDRAEVIVEEEIERFARWMGQLDVRPTIAALREQGDAIVEQVLSENEARWEALSVRDRARVEAMARAIMQRALHEPTLRLKALADDSGSGHGRLQIARELFGLEPGSQATSERRGDDATITPLDERRRPAG
jgi:glutamyl-tRNA reductase